MPTPARPRKPSPAAAAAVPDLELTLDTMFPDRAWLPILEVLAVTGVADTGQLQQSTNLPRDRVKYLLERLENLAAGTLLARIPQPIPRPGVRGRTRVVYTLGPAGAALLRAHDHPHARPGGLTAATAIAHAQATLDVRLAALAAGLAVQTERELPYAADRVLRPDNLVTLPGGVPALFETEQTADVTTLRRIVDGLTRKAAFFQAQTQRGVSPTVRVLFNLDSHQDRGRTRQIWEQACASAAARHGGPLPLRLLALPLREFLAQPDWAEPPTPGRWEPLGAPDPPRASQAEPAAGAGAAHTPARPAQLPAPLRRHAAHHDRRILEAYWQQFQEQAPAVGCGDVPRPDPAFFAVMSLIYAASHDPYADALTLAAQPHASLFLLGKYLALHPPLREALSKALVRGAGSMRWSVPTILHRMQTVMTTFLHYHGWRTDGPLRVYPALTGWDDDARPGDFGVTVQIRNPELLLGPADSLGPGAGEADQAAAALAWVLYALFAYGPDIGLKPAPFW